MPSSLLSPGILVTEQDEGLYTPNFGLNTLVLIGPASKGPMDTPVLITDAGKLHATFGHAGNDPDTGEAFYALYAAEEYLKVGRALYFLRVGTEVASGDLAAATGYILDDDGVTNAILATAVYNGSFGNNVSITVTAGTVAGTYNIAVKDGTYVVEVFKGVLVGTVNEDEDYYIETQINGVSNYITVSDLEVGTTLEAGTYTLSGGANGCPVSTADVIGSAGTPPTIPATGLYCFTNPEEYEIDLIAVPGRSEAAIVNALISFAETREDCVALIDPPNNLPTATVVDWHNGTSGIALAPTAALDSSYACLYNTWLDVTDTLTGSSVSVPPSGNVAAVIVRSARDEGIGAAPAGIPRGRLLDVLSVSTIANQGDRDYMMSQGNNVNPICKPFKTSPYTVWGQYTLLRGTGTTKNLNTRRTLIALRRTFAQTCKSLIFEPNNRNTWNRLKRIIRPTCEDYVEKGWIDDYEIVCDETTNTTAAINAGELRATVFIRPTPTAEKILINVISVATGISFSEVSS